MKEHHETHHGHMGKVHHQHGEPAVMHHGSIHEHLSKEMKQHAMPMKHAHQMAHHSHKKGY